MSCGRRSASSYPPPDIHQLQVSNLAYSMDTHLLRNHTDLRHIQAILGHAQITIIEIYTHVGLEDLKEVVRRAHPHGEASRK